MRFEDMNKRITLLKPKEQTGTIVNQDDTEKWDDYKPIWAKAEYLKGREFWSAKAVNAETSIKFIVRYRTDVNTDMAVRFNGQILDITAAVPLDNKKEWTIITVNGVSPSA